MAVRWHGIRRGRRAYITGASKPLLLSLEQDQNLTTNSYFGLTNTATKTINSILGYMPTVSHWAWNGCARRYWDFMYAMIFLDPLPRSPSIKT
jgi:hypothetical protein